jgi:hypothetical protein
MHTIPKIEDDALALWKKRRIFHLLLLFFDEVTAFHSQKKISPLLCCGLGAFLLIMLLMRCEREY